MPIIGQEFVALKLSTPGVGEFDFSENVFVYIKLPLDKTFHLGFKFMN